MAQENLEPQGSANAESLSTRKEVFMSVTEAIVHLPKWENGGYLYAFSMMVIIIIAARVTVEILKKENQKGTN
ncbi:hypothetical protein AWH56_004335 [Anaerobacillus isosaccharinicus]|uniref:Uncharacterized protein n=1 Tax=Anaerobacillus isosaccharinicus TaxID=1532552 RepID=A0A1S2L388_9BACI|nr:hypothetical protein [Anaerobacillus isosaccharinicus]MBA5584746.1 hypothetical protein [Anaerobacillus isosaccharinicus]QOY36885.1 hypothetical protein AWH56_004335 [Anaerobacillus isosaccharinicus]